MAEKKGARHCVRNVLLVVAGLVVACCVGFVIYASAAYPAGQEAQADISAGSVSSAEVPVEQAGSTIAVGSPSSAHGLVLYPGAKVSPEAYVPLACKLAQRGVLCVIVRMPLNFAFFDMDAASRVMEAYPQVGDWWVGGHSLGGAMAAQYASTHADALAGVVLLAAYSTADLSGTGLRAEVIYGSEDGVLNRQKLADCAANLPAGVGTLVIEGGNHAGFGDYGPQSGDGEASIAADEQQERTAEEIARAMAA